MQFQIILIQSMNIGCLFISLCPHQFPSSMIYSFVVEIVWLWLNLFQSCVCVCVCVVIGNDTPFLICFSHESLLMYESATVLCKLACIFQLCWVYLLILAPFGGVFLVFCKHEVMSSVNTISLTSFDPIWMLLILFSCLDRSSCVCWTKAVKLGILVLDKDKHLAFVHSIC